MDSSRFPITIRDIAYCEAGLDYYFGPHVHTTYQWYCVLYGAVEQTVNGTVYPLGAEESVLIPPGLMRSPRCRDRAPGYVRAIFENHRLRLDHIAQRVLPTPADLRPDLHALVVELQSPGANTQELVEALLVRLLVGLCRSALPEETHHSLSPLNAMSHQELVSRVEAFMRRNLHRQLARQDLADVVHLSPTHLARVFRRATGKTLIERLSELRVARAKELLMESTLSITEISLQVGYRSFSHFGTVFRGALGVSPSDYRRSRGHTWRSRD